MARRYVAEAGAPTPAPRRPSRAPTPAQAPAPRRQAPRWIGKLAALAGLGLAVGGVVFGALQGRGSGSGAPAAPVAPGDVMSLPLEELRKRSLV